MADIAGMIDTGGIDVGKLISLAQFSQQMQQQQQAIQNQNKLKALFAAPDAVDTNTGMINPKVVQQALAIDPETGLKLQETNYTALLKNAELKHAETETGKASWDFMTGLAGSAVGVYDDAIKAGKKPDEAAAAAKAFRDEQLKNNGGVLSDAQVAQAEESPFDYNKAQGLARMNKEYLASRSEAEREQHDRRMEDLSSQRINITVANQAAQNNPDALLSGDDLDYAAEKYRKTGTMPPMGLGSKGAAAMNRKRVIERAEQLGAMSMKGGALPDGAQVADSDVSGAAGVKADTSSLTNITRIADSAEAYENTAIKNFDTALSLAKKGGIPTNMGPLVNQWIQEGETMLGNKDVPPYAAALLTGANEYAKVMSGSTGSQGSTVDSRREAAAMFAKGFDFDQIKPVIDVAKRDMENKKASYRDQRSAIRDRIGGGPAGGASDNKQAKDLNPGLPQINSDADYKKLKKGQAYIHDGQYYRVGTKGALGPVQP